MHFLFENSKEWQVMKAPTPRWNARQSITSCVIGQMLRAGRPYVLHPEKVKR
jgi:hypothetical protein